MWRSRNSAQDDERTLIRDPADSTDAVYDSMRNTSRQQRLESNDSGYTELLRGSVPCPTCKGIGNVPKEQESQLIALIPLRDKRLQPSRTHIWVCLAVCICLVVAGLLVFFLFPRNVTLSSQRPYLNPLGPVYVNVTTNVVNFVVQNFVTVENMNYVPTTVSVMKVTALFDTQVLAETTNTSNVKIPIRSSKQLNINVNITLDSDNHLGYMARSCNDPLRWVHEMVMIFEFTCFYEFLGRSEQTTLQVFQYVSCYRAPTTTTTVKPNTTTTTTTTKPKTTTTSNSSLVSLLLPENKRFPNTDNQHEQTDQ